MVKVEDIQNYGKEQFEQAAANATAFQSGVQAIVAAYGEYAKSAYETFVAESQKIAGLYSDLAKQAFKPVETVVSKFTPAAN